jgi:hypothetical protein
MVLVFDRICLWSSGGALGSGPCVGRVIRSLLWARRRNCHKWATVSYCLISRFIICKKTLLFIS